MIIKPKKKSLYITVDYNDFVWHYHNIFTLTSQSKAKSSYHSKKESIVFLLKAISSFFDFMTLLFNTNQYDKNITLYTLLKLLEKDDRPIAPLSWKLKKYKNYLIENDLSFKDHLIEAFLMHLNKVHKRKPKYKKNYRLFYFIICEVKTFLFKIIRRIIYKSKRDFLTNQSYYYNNNKCFDIFIDSGYLSIIEKENPFLFYLYTKYTEDYYDKKDFYKFLNKISNNSNSDKEDLCQLIKKLPYSN